MDATPARRALLLMAAIAGCAPLLGPAALFADDVHVQAETTLQAYDVQSPASAVVWARRRLTQDLGLHYVKALDSAARVGAPGPSLALYVRLRLDQDFGDTCLRSGEICYAIINPERRGSYTPLASPGGIELPAVYIEARDLPAGSSARAGRQLYVDEVGLTRVDGVSMRLAPARGVAFDAIAGTLVRRTSVAGMDAFNSGSLAFLDLAASERARVPYAQPDEPTWLASLSTELGSEAVVRARLSARALHRAGGFIEQRLGAGLASQLSPLLRLDAHGVLDLIDPDLIDAELGAQLGREPVSAQLRVERHLPRFEPSTIWAYFDVAPIWMATLRAQVAIAGSALAYLGLRGRRTELSPASHDLGVDAAVSWFNPRDTLGLAGFGWIAQHGPLWGVSADASRRFSRVIRLEAEVSLFRVDDPLRESLDGYSLQELLAVHVAIAEQSQLQLMATHTYGESARHRLGLLFFLRFGAWR